MIRVVRTLWAARLAACVVVLGLMVQAALGAPVSVRMAEVPICSAGHGSAGKDLPDRPAHDHAHCLLCQSLSGPPLLPSAVLLEPPAGRAVAAVAPVSSAPFVAGVATGFLSRAPPFLA